MKHKEVKYRLPEFIEDKLSGSEKATIAEHLRSCEDCRAEANLLEQVYAVLPRTKADPREQYWASILPRVHERIERRKHLLFPVWVFRYTVPIGAAAVLLLVLSKVIAPERNALMSIGVREVLQGMDSAEVEQIADGSSVQPFDNLSESNTGESLLAGDKEVLKTMLAGTHNVYASMDVYMQTENVDEQDVEEILFQLNQKQFIN